MSAQKRNGGPKIASRRAEDPDVAALLEQLEAVVCCKPQVTIRSLCLISDGFRASFGVIAL